MRLSGMLSAPVALSLAAALTACGGGTPQTPAADAAAEPHELDDATHEELVELATEEGSVTVYSFTSRIASVEEAFEAQYPGIDLIGHDIASSEQITRLRSESQAGSPSADVAYISDAPVVVTELVAGGILRNYVPPRLAETVPQEYREPLLANRLSTKILMYNEEAHPDGSPVRNLWQLTEEEWNGRVVMVDPSVRGDYLDLMAEIVHRSDEMAQAHREHFGTEVVLDEGVENAGQQFIKDLYANGLVLVDDTDNVNQAVGATGQDDPPVGITSYSDRRDNEEEGWALQASLGTVPSPGITFPAYIGMVNGARNPAAARLVADFLMGDGSETGGPAYEPFYVPGDYPVRTDMAEPADAAPLEELGAWDIVPEETAQIRDGVADFLLTL
ncbi:ABC transporter substrate-binding protein [Nocardiopsis changdeensis]|uniref:Substrate-binding domain-containing protein n=1 Tax=Nocardiopsis changdeensis TaxID=2831969 RepID=A0ABX8BSK4_9ACTN|nr:MULTISPECIES: ABC transporter substrate-binding protein [Nocardiopsis]QUX25074.1 substrate-binding domain-containing protein [Nocardiopsis changdeensis]QYX35460.1 ABC transporter substrate-binding protein [Nocardiopsis sp. MT53]